MDFPSEQPIDQSDGRISGTAPRLYERAFAILAEQIRTGALGAGQQLTETSIAERFGVSRAPARRALLELSHAGLVEKSDGRGYIVSDHSGQDGALAADVDAPASPSVPPPVRLLSQPSWQPIYDEVEEEIIARIAFGAWRLNEAKLALSYYVSRTVARDVVARLQQRGLLNKDDRSRWCAPALSPELVDDLYELRAILEPAALIKAAATLSPATLAGARAHLENAIALPEVGVPLLDALEQELHVDLLRHCGNAPLIEAIAAPQSLLLAHRFLYRWTGDLFGQEPFLSEHLSIIAALERGDVAIAASLLREHLQVSSGRALARIDLIQKAATPHDLPYLERQT
ncbi:GntR family transcriptional regulator [Consotaella aegiceratis]|uniref:GntR family transcriptional regulator n=1 Tax=Consotaella aegiceratis TaxID=3097961 RepID=UPI002F42DEC5